MIRYLRGELMRRKNHTKTVIFILIAITLVSVSAVCLYLNLFDSKIYTANDFGIVTIKSPNDANGNGVDDYTDIMLGARKEALSKPTYKSVYYAGGYPPDNEGVCTDTIWRAFKNAGYSLKDLVDEDIKNNISLYPRVDGNRDTNIDFRRVPNLKVFFERHAVSYSLDPTKIMEWQPGDIVIFGNDHIAIVSDKRNRDGITYIIHNRNQPNREEDALVSYNKYKAISGHYRFENKVSK